MLQSVSLDRTDQPLRGDSDLQFNRSACNMLELAIALVAHDRCYNDIVTKFADHFHFIVAGMDKFQTDLHWRDLTLLYEHFRDDNGAGLGAGHQTGWTGLVAKLIQLFGPVASERKLSLGKMAVFEKDGAH